MHKSVMLMGGITSREEARVVLECISPTLVRGVVAIAVADVKTSRDLANALNMSLRNAQRVITALESIKAVKVVRYGKKKIIVSLNKYFKKEVLESIGALLPLIIDSLKIPPLKAPDHYREAALQLVRVLGINARPKDPIFSMVRTLLSKELRRRPIPSWLRSIIEVQHKHGLRLGSDCVKHLSTYSDDPFVKHFLEVSTYTRASEN